MLERILMALTFRGNIVLETRLEVLYINSNCAYLTTIELLPPRSQADSFVLTGSCVNFITVTAQFLVAALSAQVKQTVPDMHTNMFISWQEMHVQRVLIYLSEHTRPDWHIQQTHK